MSVILGAGWWASYEMPESCNISAAFFYSASDISVTFGFYNVLINRQKSLKGAFDL